jgi:hypothetical protein
MKLTRLAGAIAVVLAAAVPFAYAAGVFQGFPVLPSGAEQTFTGIETIPVDTQLTQGLVPETGLITLQQLGQGAIVINTTAGAQTIPNNTSWYVENVANTATTLTLPTTPVHGQIVHVAIAATQTTSIIFGASAGQTCLPACPFTSAVVAAGSGDAFLYNAPSAQWIKIY